MACTNKASNSAQKFARGPTGQRYFLEETSGVTKIVLLICRWFEWEVHSGFQLNNTLGVDDS